MYVRPRVLEIPHAQHDRKKLSHRQSEIDKERWMLTGEQEHAADAKFLSKIVAEKPEKARGHRDWRVDVIRFR